MSTVPFQDKLNDVYEKTLDFFAEQEVLKCEEEKLGDFPDLINDYSDKLVMINREYEGLLNSFVTEFSHVQTRKELILLREKVYPLFSLSKRVAIRS